MADAELPQPPFGVVARARNAALGNQTDNRNPCRCQSGQCVAVESAQVGRQNHCASRSCGSRSEQVCEVDATTDDDHAEVLVLERRHQIGFPHGVGDGCENRDAHGEASVTPVGTRTRSTEPS